MPDVHVEELETEAELASAYPVLTQLWADTDREFTRESFVAFLQELRDVEGYHLFALVADETVVAVAGVSIRMSAWYGRYAWVYDLVTDADHRSQGYGDRLLSHVERWAVRNDCETLGLSSARHREDAHRFYDRRGMESSSVIFTKSLE